MSGESEGHKEKTWKMRWRRKETYEMRKKKKIN
jgi:hypothetical protein